MTKTARSTFGACSPLEILARWIDGDYPFIAGGLIVIIIHHGENIAPKEIEDVLMKHPAIADIAIVGMPDQRTGERACTVMVVAPQQTPGLEGIRNYLNELGVGKLKIPGQVEL